MTPALGVERAEQVGGHDQRHTLPEVGRVAVLPRHMREALGYWRSSPVIAEPGDVSALARAMTAARQHRTKLGSLAYQSDRYSSIDAQSIEQDVARVSCMLLVSKARADGPWPDSTREQLQRIQSHVAT